MSEKYNTYMSMQICVEQHEGAGQCVGSICKGTVHMAEVR